MAKLTEEQKQAVRNWAAEGASLNQIQDRLKQEFELALTYLDIRLLVAELGVKIQEKPKEEPAKMPAAASPPKQAADEDFADEAAEFEPAPPPAGPGAPKVTVTVDAIAIPGMLASGKTTFSDGKSAAWYLDELGRLGMKATEPGYKPPPSDIPVFQRELDLALKRAGF
ncbi:MAG TPA: hypothetical protein VGH65_08585 [Verrucomicrobiaceae bacterium]|jgi:hypothetical protein